MSFRIEVRATSVLITPGKEAMGYLTPLINLHTYEDEFVGETKTLGFLYDEAHDTLYFHKGIDIQYVRRLLPGAVVENNPYDPYKEMRYQFEEIIPPRDEDQVSIIHFITGEHEYSSNAKDQQIFLVFGTGGGKTFCAGYSAGILGYKTLIIVHRDNLRMQWVESLYNLNGFGSDVVHELTNTQELVAIANGQLKYNYDIYIMTHATFQAACNRLGDAELIGNITRNLGIGFKIIDEAHLYFRDTLMIDFLFNVKRNLYLTATDGRSSKDENSIFKHVFANTTFYRKLATNSKHPDKWVDYISIMINTHINPNIYRYRIAPGGRMSTATYGKWVIQKDKEKTYFKVIIEILRDIYKGEPTAKVLVFLPLIDLCTECAYEITQALNYDDTFEYDLNVKTVNSHNSKAENELNKRADVIVTTIQSLGTGSDIKGITDIICCSPMVSKIVVQQVLGRIRYINKPCHYYDIVNTSVQMDVFWWKSRSKTLKRMCKSYQQLTWVDEPKKENENDTA